VSASLLTPPANGFSLHKEVPDGVTFFVGDFRRQFSSETYFEESTLIEQLSCVLACKIDGLKGWIQQRGAVSIVSHRWYSSVLISLGRLRVCSLCGQGESTRSLIATLVLKTERSECLLGFYVSKPLLASLAGSAHF